MKKLLLVLALLIPMSSSSCIGPNNAFRSIHSWNSRVTDSPWWNTVIHGGFWIVPVYELLLLGDILIFNSIEFWGGDNPFDEPQPATAVRDMGG